MLRLTLNLFFDDHQLNILLFVFAWVGSTESSKTLCKSELSPSEKESWEEWTDRRINVHEPTNKRSNYNRMNGVLEYI